MQGIWRLGLGAMFLDNEAYEEMRAHENPFSKGLGLVALVSVLVALVALVGIVSTLVEGATSPRADQVEAVVRDGLRRMPWFEEIRKDPEAMRQFEQQFQQNWQRNVSRFGPTSLGGAFLQGITEAVLGGLGVFVGWLLFALVAHFFAGQLMSGEGTLPQLFGCTALAVMPQLLNVFNVVPFVLVGGVVGTWVLGCNYLAVKTVYRLDWGRALGATVLAQIVAGLVLGLCACGLGASGGVLTALPAAVGGGM